MEETDRTSARAGRLARHSPLHILCRGSDHVVVAKPPRLLVHRNARTPRVYAALQRVRDQLDTEVAPVHRLDRATSGCLLFSTDPEATGALHTGLRDPRSTKTYVALVRGYFAADGPVVVDTPIKLGPGRFKDARSVVRVLGRAHEPRCSLVAITPVTGRSHQVRRHVRDLHHPIIGDGEHGDSRVNRHWREEWGVRRLSLHCISLSLHHPDGRVIAATSPLFKDHAKLWPKLPFWQDAVAEMPALGLPPLPMLDSPGP